MLKLACWGVLFASVLNAQSSEFRYPYEGADPVQLPPGWHVDPFLWLPDRDDRELTGSSTGLAIPFSYSFLEEEDWEILPESWRARAEAEEVNEPAHSASAFNAKERLKQIRLYFVGAVGGEHYGQSTVRGQAYAYVRAEAGLLCLQPDPANPGGTVEFNQPSAMMDGLAALYGIQMASVAAGSGVAQARAAVGAAKSAKAMQGSWEVSLDIVITLMGVAASLPYTVGFNEATASATSEQGPLYLAEAPAVEAFVSFGAGFQYAVRADAAVASPVRKVVAEVFGQSFSNARVTLKSVKLSSGDAEEQTVVIED